MIKFSEREREMNEIREAALAHYYAGSEEVKQLAGSFFRFMDIDGDGRISVWEFVEFLKQRGYRVNYNNFFIELDNDRNGYLDFYEVLVLYYIVKTKRGSCRQCNALLRGQYVTCVTCFDSCNESYDLCSTCSYNSGRSNHNHYSFLDNYAMLMTKKGSSSAAASANPGIHPNYLPGRPSCNGCRTLLNGLYFTCVTCFNSCDASYNLCSTCYGKGRYFHHHTFFLDNYAMLVNKKLSSSTTRSTDMVRNLEELSFPCFLI
ncbi:hypothetical protein HHK36_026959 [Tetracentron sinense]|uniref:EF-hand domain-containing protein n=1 Tax=Tetracentron sinense TaxID=13715 RepID=A0A835D2L5_TETSI|nr:hypothetical protein HHK36_026959 [Tetracentron sinense]